MKTVIAIALLVVAAKAADWKNVKPRYAFKNTIRPVPQANRIVGGSYATPGQFPFQAGIFLDESGFCGGSLIADNVVMTAAHCCEAVSTFDVHLGAHFIYDETEPNHQVIRSIEGLMHEDYDNYTLNNDICVIRLPSAASGSGVGIVRLPSRSQAEETFDNATTTSSGWGGRSDADPSLSPVLKFVEVVIMSNSKCADYYAPNLITSCHLCINSAVGGGFCNGDSGGPLTITESDGQKTQVGVTSFVSLAGCQGGSPHIYGKVTCYLDWLELNAGVTIRP